MSIHFDLVIKLWVAHLRIGRVSIFTSGHTREQAADCMSSHLAYRAANPETCLQ